MPFASAASGPLLADQRPLDSERIRLSGPPSASKEPTAVQVCGSVHDRLFKESTESPPTGRGADAAVQPPGPLSRIDPSWLVSLARYVPTAVHTAADTQDTALSSAPELEATVAEPAGSGATRGVQTPEDSVTIRPVRPLTPVAEGFVPER